MENQLVLIEESYGSHMYGRAIFVTENFVASIDPERAYGFTSGDCVERLFVWGSSIETCYCELNGFKHTKPCA